MARQNNASGSVRVLVNIVITAMAHLPSLAHKPSRNFAPVRLKRRFWYGPRLQFFAQIYAHS